MIVNNNIIGSHCKASYNTWRRWQRTEIFGDAT